MSPLCIPVGYPSLRKHLFIKFLHFNTLQNHNYIINRTMPTISPRFLHEYRAAWVILEVSELSLDCSHRPWGNCIVVAFVVWPAVLSLERSWCRLARCAFSCGTVPPFGSSCCRVILGVFRSSLGRSDRPSGLSRCPWAIRVILGMFTSALGLSHHP